MKLSQSQIQQLYTFTQKHYVEWYDVQTELVDHLANAVEAQLEENPNLRFEEALELEFRKFGVCGFSDVIEEKIKALNKRYRKLVWRCFRDYFKLPKIILTAFFIWIYYLALHNLSNRFIIIIPTFCILFIVPICHFLVSVKWMKRIKKQTGKKWLFDNVTLQLGGLNSILNIGIYTSIIFDLDAVWSQAGQFVFSTIVVLFALVLYVSVYDAAPKLRKQIAKQYLDYKLI